MKMEIYDSPSTSQHHSIIQLNARRSRELPLHQSLGSSCWIITPAYCLPPEPVAPVLASPGVLTLVVSGLDPDNGPDEPYVDNGDKH